MHNNNVGLGSVSILRLYEAENMLTATRTLLVVTRFAVGLSSYIYMLQAFKVNNK